MNRFYRIQRFGSQKNGAGDVIGNHKLALAIAIKFDLVQSLVEGTLIAVLYKIRAEHDELVLNSAP